MPLQVSVNDAHVCEFYPRIPMYLAQQLEIKGEINLESIQAESGSRSSGYPPMGGDMGYCPPPPDSSFGGDTGYCPPPPGSSFDEDTGYCPPPPDSTFGGDMGYCPPPPQPSFDSDYNTGYGYPSASSAFTVCFIDICGEE
jgi:hypothetical protein